MLNWKILCACLPLLSINSSTDDPISGPLLHCFSSFYSDQPVLQYIFFAVSAVCNVHPFVRQQRVHRSMTQCSPPAYWWSECCSTDLSAVVESKRRKSGNFCWWRSLGEFRATQIKSVEGEQYGRVSVWGWTARQA